MSKDCPFLQKLRACSLCSESGRLHSARAARFAWAVLCLSSMRRCPGPSWGTVWPLRWRLPRNLTARRGDAPRASRLRSCYRRGQEATEDTDAQNGEGFPRPPAPSLHSQDDKRETREQGHKIKREARELQKNGDFPRRFRRPHTKAASQRPHRDRRKRPACRGDSRGLGRRKEPQKKWGPESVGAREGPQVW